jgi:hypothetical protein
LVAILNEETGKYHTYLTNIPPDVLEPEDIAKLYGARWDIELIFKELKSRYAMDVINTKNPDIIEAYIWIAILTLLVSRRIYSIVRSQNPATKMVRYTQLRWSTIFAENASDQLKLILRYCGIEISLETFIDVYSSHALDPHVNRHRLVGLTDDVCMELNNNYRRAIFVATLNAVLRSIGMIEGSVHCKDKGPAECGLDLLEFLEGYRGARIALVGFQPVHARCF